MAAAPVPCSPSAPFVSFLPWPVSSQASVPTQEVMGTPAHQNTHRWELTPSSLCLAGPTGKIQVVAASVLCFPVAGCCRWSLGRCGALQVSGCCWLPTCSFASCPESLPPIHVHKHPAAVGGGTGGFKGLQPPREMLGVLWDLWGAAIHPVVTVGGCMHGQALRGHCASRGQPRGAACTVWHPGRGQHASQGAPQDGGHRASRGAARTVRGQAPSGTHGGGRSPVTPRPSPQRRAPPDLHLPPPPARCGSARSSSGRRGRAARGGGPGPPNGSGGPARPRRRPLKTHGAAAAAAQSSARPRALPVPASTP